MIVTGLLVSWFITHLFTGRIQPTSIVFFFRTSNYIQYQQDIPVYFIYLRTEGSEVFSERLGVFKGAIHRRERLGAWSPRVSRNAHLSFYCVLGWWLKLYTSSSKWLRTPIFRHSLVRYYWYIYTYFFNFFYIYMPCVCIWVLSMLFLGLWECCLSWTVMKPKREDFDWNWKRWFE